MNVQVFIEYASAPARSHTHEAEKSAACNICRLVEINPLHGSCYLFIMKWHVFCSRLFFFRNSTVLHTVSLRLLFHRESFKCVNKICFFCTHNYG